ncbi:MAG: hypothetical protein WBG86_12760 [Polyangiales bacterium]
MSAKPPGMRVVDRFVDHGPPLSFRELCARVVEEGCDYLLLDLDKTTHLGRNMGELLAWELCAYEAYGESETERPVRRWFGGRLLVDWSKPTQLVRYLASGTRRWTSAGIHYLVWAKLASRTTWLQRLAYRRFGANPTSAVQRRPQSVALAHLATADESLLRKLAHDVWNRQAPDQVISREDLDWVRARCPEIEIVLCSASPKSMVEVAVEQLGADRAIYSTPERINSGKAKIEELRRICPGAFQPGVKVLAITDTSYCEDHCWSEHFACVVDINSPTPFAPIVTWASPTRVVHSATVLTRDEQRRREDGDVAYLDPRRKHGASTEKLELDGTALRRRLDDLVAEINRLAAGEPSPRQEWEVAHERSQLIEASRAVLTRPDQTTSDPWKSTKQAP